MTLFELIQANLFSPPVLCFALGALAAALRSDLRLPDSFYAGLSIFLMLAIGLKGGYELAKADAAAILAPLAAAVALGCAIPLWCYAGLRRFVGLSPADAGGLAAHYGSVSAVTFAAVTALLDQQGQRYEGFAPVLLAVMEVPAIVIGVGLARIALARTSDVVGVNGGGAAVLGGAGGGGSRWAPLFNEVLASRSIVLLLGGLLIGALTGAAGMARVKPFFGDLFQGVLCLFLLELGRVAASRAGEFRAVGPRLAVFAVAMPLLHGALGVGCGHLAGLSQGGAVVLGTLAASASYIAAPAAVRLALPEANPSYYLTCSLAITFPFNIILGLPLYQDMAAILYR